LLRYIRQRAARLISAFIITGRIVAGCIIPWLPITALIEACGIAECRELQISGHAGPAMTQSIWRDFSKPAALAGIIAAVVGFASSFAIVIKGLAAAGASPAQATSGLMVLSVGMGLCAIMLTLSTRMPVSVAWSTPGAALLASAGAVEGGFAAAVGAFIICAGLLVLAGTVPRLGRLVSSIPTSLANAMLAGVLLGLCLAPARAVAQSPLPALAIIAVWLGVLVVRRIYAIPAALLMTIVIVIRGLPANSLLAGTDWLVQPVWVMPEFSLPALIGIALPLFLVTMASQNLPGVAVLNANGYRPDASGLIRATGLFSLVTAPLGGHAVNLSAITAALCAGPEAGSDPARRYWASLVCGAAYVLFGLLSGLAMALVSLSPPLLIEAVAGLALIASFGAAMSAAMADVKEREAALVTFLVTASGLSFVGIGGAFWGLMAGLVVLLATRWRDRKQAL
jgi:benzoate membrane transport protein